MTAVIANASPLIGLSAIGRLGLLNALFGEIHIPTAVRDEVLGGGTERAGYSEISRALAGGWLQVKPVDASTVLATLKVDLDDGEAEAIALALDSGDALLLLDERKARAKAKGLGLRILGTIGVLLLARNKGLEPNLQPALDDLREHGFWISPALYRRILKSP